MMLMYPKDEYWQWVEVYPDRSVPQFNEDGSTRHFHDIDQEALLEFQLIHKSGKKVVIPKIEADNWRLIHFYRCGVTFHQGKKESFRFPVAGYQITKSRKNFKVLIALFDDGNIKILYE